MRSWSFGLKAIHDTSRAERRHHRARLKKARQQYWGRDWSWCTPEVKTRRMGKIVATPAPCSCFMCGNPRKYFSELTLQERRASQREKLRPA